MKTTKKVSRKVSRKSSTFNEVYVGNIAGVQYGEWQLITKKPKAGAELKLVAEPSNKFDPDAIKVMYGNRKIGYIKRNDTEELHKYHAAGAKFKAMLRSVNANNPSWYSLVVAVSVDAKQTSTDRVF